MDFFQKVSDFKNDFTTYPLSFDKYKWYNPICVLILTSIIYIILILAVFFILDFFVPGLPDMLSFDITKLGNLGPIVQIVLIASVALLFPSIFIAIKIVRERPFSSCLSSVGGWRWNNYVKSFAITFLVYFVVLLVEFIISGAKISHNNYTILTMGLLIVFVLLQGFSEELVFRGFLMQTLGSWFKLPIVAIIIQGVLFGLIHGYNSAGLISVVITGLTYGWLSWYSKGIESSSAMHGVNNIFSLIFAGLGLKNSNSIAYGDMLMSVFLTIVPIILVYLIDKKYNILGLNENNEE